MRYARTLVVGSIALASFAAHAWSATVRVGAAISLKESLEAVAHRYSAETGDEIELTFGSSGQIAAQIRAGAPMDLFISAANRQVDDLQANNLVDALTRRVVVTNRLVLIVPADATNPPDAFWRLSDASVQRIAIGDPRTVPAGEYAMQALEAFQVAGAVRDKLVYGTNVRQVLTYVERSEVSAGIVYATDAQEAGDRVRVVATAESDKHRPIVYPAVVVTAATDRAAASRFLEYLSGGDAQAIFKERGFVTAESVAPPTATHPATRPAAP